MTVLNNFIVKTKNAKESEIRKALKEAGIDVISVATVYKEDVSDSSESNEKTT